MSNRIRYASEEAQDGLKLVFNDEGLLRRWWDIAEGIMRLSHSEIKTAFKVMMWDIYEGLGSEIQQLIREVLIRFEDQGDIEMWLLTVIGLFNIVWQIQPWATFSIPEGTKDIYDFVKSDWFEITMFHDLFNQVDHYRVNGKLLPPEMIAIWNVEKARTEWRESVKDLLEDNASWN